MAYLELTTSSHAGRRNRHGTRVLARISIQRGIAAKSSTASNPSVPMIYEYERESRRPWKLHDASGSAVAEEDPWKSSEESFQQHASRISAFVRRWRPPLHMRLPTAAMEHRRPPRHKVGGFRRWELAGPSCANEYIRISGRNSVTCVEPSIPRHQATSSCGVYVR